MTTTLDEFILQWVGTNLTYIRRHKLTYMRKQFFIFEGQNYPDDPMHVIKKLSWILVHLVLEKIEMNFLFLLNPFAWVLYVLKNQNLMTCDHQGNKK